MPSGKVSYAVLFSLQDSIAVPASGVSDGAADPWRSFRCELSMSDPELPARSAARRCKQEFPKDRKAENWYHKITSYKLSFHFGVEQPGPVDIPVFPALPDTHVSVLYSEQDVMADKVIKPNMSLFFIFRVCCFTLKTRLFSESKIGCGKYFHTKV